MGKPKGFTKWIPKRYRSYVKKHWTPLKKTAQFVFRWRIFWLLVFCFICLTVYKPAAADPMINFISHIKPPFAKMPPKAKLDINLTVEYKKNRLVEARSNLSHVLDITLRDLGFIDASANKVVSVNAGMPAPAGTYKVDIPTVDERPVESELSIIKDNLLDALKAYVQMMTVRIVTIDNKPVIIGDNGKIVPYDKTDRILRWADYIEAAAKKYNTDPAIIAAIIEQESGGDASVVSPAGAVGLMQLMPRTAKGLGVNPYDPAQNIDGGTRYFLYQYREFGNVVQALAAYNAGPGNVKNGNYLYFSETQGYITKVPRLIEKYRQAFSRGKTLAGQ